MEWIQNLLCIVSFPADNGDMRLSNSFMLYYPSGYSEYSGRVEIFVNGQFVDICSGSIDVQEVCNNFRYPGIL